MFFFFHATATTEIYTYCHTLSLHDALPILLGPFFVADAPEMKSGANITNGMEGQPLYVMGRVIAPTGEPLADALVDVWQSDGDGYYDVQMADRDDAALRAR